MRRRPLVQLILLVVLAVAAAGSSGVRLRADDTVTVFAAASLTTVVDAMAPLVKAETGLTIRASYGSSATLARQIEAGAPADLFISADQDWMRYLAERRLVAPPIVGAIATNALVIVSPAAADTRLVIGRGFPLRDALGTGRLAVGDPVSVPAGKYAHAALQFYGVWDAVQNRLAPAENVRVALQLVARGECPLGIVYATDARAEPGVRVVATFPEPSHDPIVYPAAVTTRAAGSAATRVLAWLQSAPARRVLVEHGFGTPDGPTTR